MRMKMIPLTAAVIFSVSAIFAFAETKPAPISSVLDRIRQEQGVKTNEEISAEKVPLASLEALGDSVTEAMIGNSARHGQMETMMGGEGSASLKAMQQRIGYNYLSEYPMGMINLMSGRMTGYSLNTDDAQRGRFMMNSTFRGMTGSFGWHIGGVLMWILIVFLSAVILFLVYKRYSKSSAETAIDPPLEILKKRYAKGDISREDFEKMKKDVTESSIPKQE